MRPVIAFTANNRPRYLAETLDSWRKVRGITSAHLIFRCEPGNPDVTALCHDADFATSLHVIVNPERYGALGNPWHAFETGFATEADFMILAEDDSPVADDILEYFAWCQEHYRDAAKILGACAFRKHPHQGGQHGVSAEARFSPTVWGTWRDRWNGVLRDDWDFDYRHKGWDWHISEHHIAAAGYRFAAPCQSRSQVSGKHGGTHMSPEIFADHLSGCFSPHYPPGEFAEVPCASW